MKKIVLGILITLSILNASEVTPTKVLELLGFNALYHHTCGPNSADVKVMKPMAEKISDYIIKHGIPKSLKDIPDLPYGLVGCERSEEYSKFNEKLFKYVKVKVKKNATSEITKEKCHFFKKDREYYLNSRTLFELKENTGGISIDIGNDESKTWDTISFHVDKNSNVFSDSEIDFGSSKNTGICKPWRQ